MNFIKKLYKRIPHKISGDNNISRVTIDNYLLEYNTMSLLLIVQQYAMTYCLITHRSAQYIEAGKPRRVEKVKAEVNLFITFKKPIFFSSGMNLPLSCCTKID